MYVRHFLFCMLMFFCLSPGHVFANTSLPTTQALNVPPLFPQAAPTPPAPPVVSPDQMQTEQRANSEQQQEELQRDSREYLLMGKKMPPITQCRGLLRKQWHVTGLVYFLSANLREGSPAVVQGTAAFPIANDKQEIHYYQCIFDKDRTKIVGATIGDRVLKLK